jgi:hypothetical protein
MIAKNEKQPYPAYAIKSDDGNNEKQNNILPML